MTEMDSQKRCAACGAAWEEHRTPGYNEVCRCGVPWRVCANCRFCDFSADRNWCREPAARDERPRDKATASRCQWFVLGDNFAAARESRERAERAKAALAALTGGK